MLLLIDFLLADSLSLGCILRLGFQPGLLRCLLLFSYPLGLLCCVLSVCPLFVCAEKYNEVAVYSTYRDDYTRDTLYMARADAPGLSLGWKSQQEMIIALQSLVIPTESSAELLNMLKSMTDESSVTSRDNGVTQEVTVKTGVSLAKTVQVKPRVKLTPFRTFLEISQPESEYLVRVDKGNQIGLFEADGGIWKLEAKKSIAMYFKRELADLIESGKVVVIR